MNPDKIAAVGARRIERGIEDRRKDGRLREAAYRALCKEVAALTLSRISLLEELFKANTEITRLCEKNEDLRNYIKSLEDTH